MLYKKVYDFIKDYKDFVLADSKRKPFTASYVLDDKIVLNHNKEQTVNTKVFKSLLIDDVVLDKPVTLNHYHLSGIIVDVNSNMIILVKEGEKIG